VSRAKIVVTVAAVVVVLTVSTAYADSAMVTMFKGAGVLVAFAALVNPKGPIT